MAATCGDLLGPRLAPAGLGFVTLFFGRLDPARRTLTYGAGGHPAFVIDQQGDVTTLASANIPLGLLADNQYQSEQTVSLRPSDMLLMMTDGAWEAHQPNGAYFGRQRIFELVHEHRSGTADDIVRRVVEEIHRFCHPGLPQDDVTIVVVKVGSCNYL